MTVFGSYSRYYDLLYSDKGYGAEVEFVQGLLESHAKGARSILEFGCGTGMHALLLADRGYHVHGIDMSEEMLIRAKARLKGLPNETSDLLDFSLGDIRAIRMGRRFDALISLFHVMSYQSTDNDLRSTFARAREHLKPGGIFIFDFWYGPTVLHALPSVRVRRMEDEHVVVTRIAEPLLLVNENSVDVNYQIIIRDKVTGEVSEILESHRMRYLFLPEIRELFAANGMEMLFACEWLTGREPGLDTWGVCCGGRLGQ